jgi:hypothetical protein
MKTIIVVFAGLIAHVNQPLSFDNTAVLIRALDHEAMILIPSDSVAENPADEWLLQFERPDELNVYRIPLADRTVRLSGTRGVFCDRPQDILDHVPRLRSLAPTCGGLKEHVRERIPDAEFASFFDYRGGELKTIDYLRNQLKSTAANGDEHYQCASCRVAYAAELRDDHAVLTFKDASGTHKIVVPAGSKIEVQNSPVLNTGSHFHEFYKIFENCTADDTATVEESARPCVRSRICNPVIPYPFGDCTNSQYP